MNKLIIYTDGGSRNNPGPAAIGIVIQGESYKLQGPKEYSEYIGEATNNEAEYHAVIFALKKAKHLSGKKKIKDTLVEIRLDSELVGKQLQGKFKLKEENLFPLFIEIWNLRQSFGSVEFKVVSREKNRAADRLVNHALDRRERDQKLF